MQLAEAKNAHQIQLIKNQLAQLQAAFNTNTLMVDSAVYRTSDQQDTIQDEEVRQILLKYSNRSSNLLTNDDYVELSKYTTRIVKYPQILPIVLHAIALHDCQTYNNFIKELQSLYLQRIPLETAMELLDFEYTDTAVRNLAVWQLEQLNSYDLRTFTIQLVQSLKFERSTELFKYLVTQAVNNFKEFGFDFYWALRSEMKHSLAHGQIYKLMLIKILLGISETDRKDLLKTE